jgi:HSP20 family protein
MARRPHPIRRLERVIDRLREEVETDVEAGLSGSGMLLSGIEVDILDRGDEIVVRANVPGFGEDDLSVTAEDDKLVIAADVASAETDDGGEAGTGEDGEGAGGEGTVEGATVLRRERPHRDLRRIVRLPVPVDADGAEATCERGVLDVVLPKAEGTDGTAIDID